jgi:hypothetical protein
MNTANNQISICARREKEILWTSQVPALSGASPAAHGLR